MENSEIADVIERAVDILESERKGWCQGRYYDANRLDGRLTVTSVCALGAVRLALVEESDERLVEFEKEVFNNLLEEERPLNHREDLVFMALNTHLNKALPQGEQWDGIHAYNDEIDRTKEQVIEVMKGAVKDLRNADKPML